MSRREEFKTRMKALKLYRDTTGKGYWEWKVLALSEGGDTQEPERVRITSDTDLTEFSKSMKDFANWWYNERNKLAKYQYLLQNIDDIHHRINNSKYLSGQDITPIVLKDDLPKLYEQILSLPEDKRNIRYNLISEQMMKGKAGFSYPSKGVYTGARNRGIMYHEGVGHIVGDTTPVILNSTPIKTLNKKVNSYFDTDQNEYNNYINLRNERHAQLWQFRGENLNVQDDKGYLIDPNRQVTPDEIKALREARKLRLPQEWINSGMTDEDIANLHNTVAENTTTKDNEVFAGKNGGEIPSYKEGGDNEYDNLMTTVATNALRDAANRGDRALVEKILKAKIGEPKEFYYPDSGAITPFLNIYDLPIIGDAFSLVDATKSLVYKDYDNAAMQYLNAVLPAAVLGKSKLNWKEWNLKKKYIPEYEAIEREAKKNGTWLKNEDGTDFTGDAREWVAKRSKRFKDVFGDNYKEGYTGMRNPYDPNLTTDTYLGSKDRAYTYTLSKGTVRKKGDTGIAKLVVPDTDTYTVDALGNDWLHLTDKSINPYNFTNTNLIVSKITTPTISFKNIRDDGPFGMRDIAEDQFVIKANTPKKSVLYNNGDFDLSNPDIFKATITPYIGYKLYNKANRENTQSYAIGGETENSTNDRTDHPISIRLNLDKVLSVADFTDRINHTDPNIGEYNPFYNAYDDTYGTVPLQEVTVTAPWTKLGRNNAAARRGMHYMQQGLEDAAKVAAPIVAGAVLPAMSSTGLLLKAVDLASVVIDPTNPLNYIPFYKTLDKYLFLKHPNSFTRGIGGEEGLRDLIETGLVRGNPIGTEVSAKAFGKMYRKNRFKFRTITDNTNIKGIANRYYNRSLTKADFDAIKREASLVNAKYKPNEFFGPMSLDPLEEYNSYEDYLRIINEDKRTLRNATSLDETGQPLAYFYDDGRNPLIKGYDYASSKYGVRVNNASSYSPRIFEGHQHYSFPHAISLYDPNVEVFKRGFLGITTKINKDKLYRYLNNSN